MSGHEDYDFVIKQDDDSPALESTLQQGGVDYDLTGASVKFHMRARGADTTKVDATATVVDQPGGKVKYDWQVGDTDTVGVYECEWEVENADATTTTFPSDGYFTVFVTDDLA